MIKLSKDQNVVNSFIPGDYVVYPSHGVGKIIGTENRKVEDIDLELLVVRFEHERMTLRVPLSKANESGLRTLSSKVQMEMADYIDKFMKKEEGHFHAVTRHILGLYNSLPGAKEWRRVLSENTRSSKNGDILRLATDNIEEFIHTRSLILA